MNRASYCFNTKLIKKFVDAQKERITEVASNIAPTIYDTNKTVEVMDAMQVISITNVIKPTTRKSVYIVNHNYIFRGNYTEFIQLYKEMYGDKDVIVNEDGKIVLDY